MIEISWGQDGKSSALKNWDNSELLQFNIRNDVARNENGEENSGLERDYK